MMGPEPFQKALEDGADVVIAGRASDAAIYAAIPLMQGPMPGSHGISEKSSNAVRRWRSRVSVATA